MPIQLAVGIAQVTGLKRNLGRVKSRLFLYPLMNSLKDG